MSFSLVRPSELLTRRILVIDDEQANILLLRSLLEREGYSDIHCLADSSQAPAEFVRLEPDLVLLDLMMPAPDGFQLLEAFKRHARADTFLPVLVLTADTTLGARRRALSLGANDFVSKPFDLVEVGLRIGNLLETRILYERLRALHGPS